MVRATSFKLLYILWAFSWFFLHQDPTPFCTQCLISFITSTRELGGGRDFLVGCVGAHWVWSLFNWQCDATQYVGSLYTWPWDATHYARPWDATQPACCGTTCCTGSIECFTEHIYTLYSARQKSWPVMHKFNEKIYKTVSEVYILVDVHRGHSNTSIWSPPPPPNMIASWILVCMLIISAFLT